MLLVVDGCCSGGVGGGVVVGCADVLKFFDAEALRCGAGCHEFLLEPKSRSGGRLPQLPILQNT